MDLWHQVKEATDFLRNRMKVSPKTAITLGSGLGELTQDMRIQLALPFVEIPHFPRSTVPGHEGKLYFGTLGSQEILAFSGRVHAYEGIAPEIATLPIRVIASLGIEGLILTNAAGAINRLFSPGDLMILSDHISLQPNPLIGPNDDRLGPRFVSLFPSYNPEWVEILERISVEKGIGARTGTYLAVTGPSYCTPAELRMFRLWGADAIGMSTVAETIVARHAGIKMVAGISCITDMATGEGNEVVSHEIVMDTARKASQKFRRFVREFVAEVG